MATGVRRGEVRFDEIYNENDAADPKLLNLVAHHIIYDVNSLRCIARDVGINNAQFSRIVNPNRTESEHVLGVSLQVEPSDKQTDDS